MFVCDRCHATYRPPPPEFCGVDGGKVVERDTDPLIAKTLGNYRIIETLGNGAMGIVYRGKHQKLDRACAIKVLYGELNADRTMVERFQREAEVLNQLDHQNVVSIMDFCTTDAGLHYIVMELVTGPTLKEVMRAGPLSPSRAANITRQLALGVHAAHALNYVHRDLKPANVILVPQGETELVKILDFGLAAAANNKTLEDRLTSIQVTIGTPRYMAPEQFINKTIGPSADLYALGIILYEMITGRTPFAGSDLILRHASEIPKPPVGAGALGELALFLLAKTPEARPRDATQVVQEIDRLLASNAIATRRDTSSGPETYRLSLQEVLATEETPAERAPGLETTVPQSAVPQATSPLEAVSQAAVPKATTLMATVTEVTSGLAASPQLSRWLKPRHAIAFAVPILLALVLLVRGPSTPGPAEMPARLLVQAPRPVVAKVVAPQVARVAVESKPARKKTRPRRRASRAKKTSRQPSRSPIRKPTISEPKKSGPTGIRLRLAQVDQAKIKSLYINGSKQEKIFDRIKLDAGVHLVEVWTTDGLKHRRHIHLSENENRDVRFQLNIPAKTAQQETRDHR